MSGWFLYYWWPQRLIERDDVPSNDRAE